jgi:DNA (cytosine-5)-methyltransferase 1
VTAYYNEHDPFAAAWLRELIADGLIAPGEVDERSIEDVTPNELRPFRQVHLFAGIGIWSAALRGAGWSDDREAWTISCPCQPFSAAGQRAGFADERHLWPSAYHLIGQCRPPVIFGEQSSSKGGLAWIDLVSADMEAANYSGGPLDLCSAGFGAPNIRQRNYFVWVADADGARSQGRAGVSQRAAECVARPRSLVGGLADTDGGNASTEGLQRSWEHGQRAQDAGNSTGGVPGPANGFWRAADWILCRDPDGPRWRPVEPGTFPLATGHSSRVAKLRGSGNALNKEVAQGFIEAVMDVRAIADRNGDRQDAKERLGPKDESGGAGTAIARKRAA